MKKILLLFVGILAFSQINAQTSIFNNLLQQHVTKDGVVDYKAFKENQGKLDSFISYLEKTSP
ncbi:MAG: DUF547 domain-containing protein, partial [Polaribacter sp.]